jgi:hypothetical protein
MAISPSTTNALTDWYSKYKTGGNTAPTGSSFGSAAATAAKGASTGNQTAGVIAGAAKPSATTSGGNGYDVAAWYRQAAGREADAGGKSFWEGVLASGADPGNVYNDFVKELADNNDLAKPGASTSLAPSQLDLDKLVKRNVSKNQTVSGQIGDLLDTNSSYLQSARDRSMRASNARGLSNSSIAASAGEAAAYEAALPIATSDAQAFRDVDSYNAALANQGLMYNTDAQNTFKNNQLQIDANTSINTQNNATSTKNNAANIAAQSATNAANNANQLTVAQLQAETSRYQADKSNASSQYNTDANIKNQAEQNKTTLVNNIIQSPELSPDRKAALLRQLGEEGLASAIFIGSVSDDLNFSNEQF